jgi:hypothetical protein
MNKLPTTPLRGVPTTPLRGVPTTPLKGVPMEVEDPFSYVKEMMAGERAAAENKVTRGMMNRHIQASRQEGGKRVGAGEAEAAREATMLGGLKVVTREVVRAKMMEIVDINIIRVSKKNNFAVPDISWTEEMEKEYEEELEYSYNNDDYPYPSMLPNSSFGAITKTEQEIVDELNNGHPNGTISNYWYYTKDTHPADENDKSLYSQDKSGYSIDVNHLPAFRCIRGVGGAIYILRYFQFIDMVHDMCHKRGDASNSWALNKIKVKSACKQIKNLYIDDINWLINKNIKP